MASKAVHLEASTEVDFVKEELESSEFQGLENISPSVSSHGDTPACAAVQISDQGMSSSGPHPATLETGIHEINSDIKPVVTSLAPNSMAQTVTPLIQPSESSTSMQVTFFTVLQYT